MQTTIVTIPGIHCSSCAMLIEDESSDFPGIENVEVDVTARQVKIVHDEDMDIDQWIAAIEGLSEAYRVTRS